MRWWLTLWRRLTGARPRVAALPQREPMPEMHALRERQTVYRLRTDLLRRQLAAETRADRAIYGEPDDAPH